MPSEKPSAAEIAARCHEIQTGLGLKETADFDQLRSVGMAVRMALHIRGLAAVNYQTLRLVALNYLGIPSSGLQTIVELLAEVEFVKLQTEGKTIKTVIPTVPYYETLYETLGSFAIDTGFNEAEQLSIDLLCRLSKSPENVDRLQSSIGAESRLFKRAFELGNEGSYLRTHRIRGRNIAISPTYFSENEQIFADMVAGSGSQQVAKLLTALQRMQGTPLSLIKKNRELAGISLSEAEINLLVRLAQDGAVKPPNLVTDHAGEQFFLFTPTPSGAALAPTKRDIYERAMAIVAAVRQGQLLPKQYAIRSPGAVLWKLRSDMKLGKATTEARQQYQQLVHIRVARLVPVTGGYYELHIIDTPENREALKIAYDLVNVGVTSGTEIDDEARKAMQQEYTYVESLVASGELHRREVVALTQEQQMEMENLFLK